MITPAIRQTAYYMLDRRSHLDLHEQALWLWYFLSENPMWKHHSIPDKINMEEAHHLAKEYNERKSKN